MRTLDLTSSLYRHYGAVEEITHYYGLLAHYALVPWRSRPKRTAPRNGLRNAGRCSPAIRTVSLTPL